MSRHRFCPQWAFQVATPKIHVATSLAATHVATSKLMSRPQVAPQIQVTTLSSLNQVATSLRCRDFRSPSLCHDMKFMSQPRPTSPSLNQTRSRPQIWVATQHWNLAVAILASALHQKNFSFFFSNPPVAFLLLLRCSSLNTAIHTTSNIFIKIILFNFLQFYTVKP